MKKTSYKFLTKIIPAFLLMFGLGVVFWQLFSSRTEAKNTGFDDFSEIRKTIEKYHPAPTDEKIKDSLIHALVQSYGDKYTTYFSPNELLSFQTMIDGDFEWIWAYVEGDVNGIYISGVLPGSPAQEAGLLPGDIIQAVDNETMHAKTADEAVRKIRWPAGTPVTLEIFSNIMGTKKQVTLIRRHLEIPIIQDSLHGDTLVIQLFSFNDYSRDDVQAVLDKNAGKYKKILLDLRNNGGGTLQSAVDVGSLFLSSGKLIATVDGQDKSVYVSHGTKDLEIPLFLLVNGQTASAAEILASALHFHLKAPVYGSQTYGKWSVQQLFPLSNGGELKITIAHWKTADNVLLDGVGITPNTVVLPTAEEVTTAKDGQLAKTLANIHALPTHK